MPDSKSKGCKFKSWQKWRENFLLWNSLSVLTPIQCLLHPRITTVACKRPRSFCQKYRRQVTPKHAYTLVSSKPEWADYAAVQAQHENLSGNELTHLLWNIQPQSSQLTEPLWLIMAWSWTLNGRTVMVKGTLLTVRLGVRAAGDGRGEICYK